GSTGKGLERIRVEERKVIFNVQRLHPFRVPMRQRRPEADRVDALEVPVDALGLPQELRSRAKGPAVVVNPVHANLESTFAQVFDQVEVETVVLGDEVEGGAEAVAGVQLGELTHQPLAFARFHIVGDHEGEVLPVGPEVDEWQHRLPPQNADLLRDLPEEAGIAWLDRPAQVDGRRHRHPVKPPQPHGEASGYERLHRVVQTLDGAQLPMLRTNLTL